MCNLDFGEVLNKGFGLSREGKDFGAEQTILNGFFSIGVQQ